MGATEAQVVDNGPPVLTLKRNQRKKRKRADAEDISTPPVAQHAERTEERVRKEQKLPSIEELRLLEKVRHIEPLDTLMRPPRNRVVTCSKPPHKGSKSRRGSTGELDVASSARNVDITAAAGTKKPHQDDRPTGKREGKAKAKGKV